MKQKQHMDRIQNNMARVYARRVLELAAMSAATLASTTALQAAIEKPPEWSTIDLAEERRKFGENFSTLGKSAISRVWAAGSRLFNLGLLASPLAILVPVAYITAPITSKPNQLAWDYAVWSAEKAGPTFIKLIQWATTRNDLFPSQFIEHFAVLQDSTRGHSWKETEKLLKSSLGDNWNEWFEFESVKSGSRPNDAVSPIGSGCIAQVYKAKLKKSTGMLPAGSQVAIKVTHPNILHKVCVDFYILNKITSWMEAIPYINLDYLSIKDSVQQFRDIMLPQLDLRVEARNLKRFRRDFSGDERVSFPQPISELTSEKVLVESFVHGEPILKFCIEGRKSNKDREDLAKVGLSTVMKMIFLHDFVHGDLHPGNIIVDRNTNAKGHPYRLNMIDCGLIVEMGEQDHVNLVKVLGAFIKKDGYLAAQLMIDSSKKCNSSELDIELFCKGIQRIIELDQERHFLESVGDYLADICYLACKHKVKLEASFINAALACEIMEGIASKLYPTLEVQHIALPMVVKAEFMHGLKSYKKDWF
jgi:aarF domain-containing kinase